MGFVLFVVYFRRKTATINGTHPGEAVPSGELAMSRRSAVPCLLLSLVLLPISGRAAEDGETWWSLRPLAKPTPPAASGAGQGSWCRTTIDQFVLSKLRKKR